MTTPPEQAPCSHARDAREFADHERAEHQRWKHVAED